jgi:hypothetical protein
MAPLIVSCGDPCGNEVSQTLRSPSGKFDAVVFNRNCGATTGFNTQVSVVPAGTKLPADGGNVFIANGTLPISLTWQSDTKLQVGGVSSVSPLKKESNVSSVEVSYAL